MERLKVITAQQLYREDGNGYHQTLPAAFVSQFDSQIAVTPTLESLGLTMYVPFERKDGGAVSYTTVVETVRQWSEDPYGNRTLDFVKKVYGIEDEDFDRVMDDAGMSEYLQHKRGGRYIGMVAAQILKPTYYFISNALMLGHLSRQGIPTAFMVGEYTSDTFYTGNADKGQSFGILEFPVGIETKVDDTEIEQLLVKTVLIELKPYGIKNDDGSVRRIKNIDEANGFRCDQVLVEITGAKGPENQDYTHIVKKKGFSDAKIPKTAHTYYEAALGMHIPRLLNDRKLVGKEEIIDPNNPETTISIADFYRYLWVQTIEHLREAGELPSAEEMPMFFVDARKIYSVIAQEANPPQLIKDIIGITSEMTILTEILKLEHKQAKYIATNPDKFSSYLRSRNLRQLSNGLLVRLDNGVMDPSCYYPVQNIWPDGYLECSSCGGKTFVDKIARGQEVQQTLGMVDKEVRLPDQEIPDLEQYVVHPTGKYFTSHHREFDDVLPILKKRIGELVNILRSSKTKDPEIQEEVDRLRLEIGQREETMYDNYFERIRKPEDSDYTTTGLILPPSVAATYRELLRGVIEAIYEPQVQATIWEVRRRLNLQKEMKLAYES